MSLLISALDRHDVANYVNALFLVYIILIFARVLLSWVESMGRVPHSATFRPMLDFVSQTTDPYLNVFRRVIRPIGPFDISPMLAIIVLLIAQQLIVGAIDHG